MELKQEYLLTGESIDSISDNVNTFLEELKTERKNQLRIRLLVEDLLLDWREKFSEDAKCLVKMGKSFGRPYISLEVEGESSNPLEKEADEYGSYRNRLLANMGLAPLYSYVNGRNRMVFKLKKQKMNPLLSLAIVVAAAVVVGLLGMLLPDQLRQTVLNNVLTPVYDTFFNLLGTIAGPMVFLSVAWGIYGIGDTSTFGRIGKSMILHFIGMVFLICALGVVMVLPFLSLNLVLQSGDMSQLGSLFQMILGFIPTDIVTPFQDGNSMQIILLGAAVGAALLILGKQTEIVAQSIEQINYIIQFFMEFISAMVPAFIFIVLVQMIWSDTLDVVLSAWKPVVLFVAAGLLLSAGLLLFTSFRCKASPMMILKKCFPGFLIALTTASSVASFGTCANSCEKKLGVRSNITSFGVPLGIVMFPPGTAISFIVICIYTAEMYAVECSLTWFILAIFTAVILAIASPPIPGGTLTCYTILFAQLGLPEEAIVVALTLNVLLDFVATGMNMFCLQLEILLQARRLKMVNEKVLHKV